MRACLAILMLAACGTDTPAPPVIPASAPALPAPIAEGPVELPSAPPLVIAVDETGAVTIAGTPADADEQDRQMLAYVSSVAAGTVPSATVQTTSATPQAAVADLLSRLHASGITRVALAAEGPEAR